MMEHLSTKLDLHAGILLVGDFNRCPSSHLCRRFNLKQIVKQPTRGDAGLDLIITNLKDLYNPPQLPPQLPPTGLSDHNTVLCISMKLSLKNEAAKLKRRLCKTGRSLLNTNWSNLYRAASV